MSTDAAADILSDYFLTAIVCACSHKRFVPFSVNSL